jgi:HlyD family secretion protein
MFRNVINNRKISRQVNNLINTTRMKIIHGFTYILCLAAMLASCSDNGKETFAYGNFETEDVIVSSEVSGRMEVFAVNQGDRLTAGQMAGHIDTIQLSLKRIQLAVALKAMESGIAQAEAQMEVNRVSYKTSMRELERFTELWKEGAATSKQLDDIKAQTDLLNAQFKVLQFQKASVIAERDAQKIQLLQISDQINRSLIKSPIGGNVLETYIRQGEIVVPGKALFKVAETEKLILRVFISGDQLSLISIGDPVKVLTDAPDGNMNETNGKVTWISPQAEFTPKIIQTRKERVNLVYAMKIEVVNDGSLKIGMPAEIALR